MNPTPIRKTWIQGQPLKLDELKWLAYEGENASHTFIISGQNSQREPVAISGTISSKFIRCADNATIPLDGVVSDGIVSVTLTDNCYAMPGRFVLSIFTDDGDHNTCIYCGVGRVYRTDTDTAFVPEMIINDVTQLIIAIQNAINNIPADYTDLLESIAPEFSTITPFTKGSCVWYDGELYVFTDNHPAGSWTGEDVEPVVLSDLINGCVRYDREQSLTDAQKAQARENLGIADAGAVRYDEAQTLSAAEKAQAQQNIGLGDIDQLVTGVVKYSQSQSLNDSQKEQARTNIGAARASDVSTLSTAVTTLQGLVTAGLVTNVEAVEGGIKITWTNGETDTISVSGGSDLAAVEYDSSYYLHFYDSNGDELYNGPFFIQGGGGGAAGYSVRIINNMGSTTLTVASTQQTILSFKYVEYYGSEIEYSNGLMTVQYKLSTESEWRTFITNQQVASNANQSVNVTSLLSEGLVTNIRVICSNGRTNEDAQTKTLQYNITSVAMGITTTFNSAATYTGNMSIPYICTGRGLSKTVYLYIDGTEYTHVDVGTSHNQALQLPVTLVGNYAYGAHLAKLWFVTSDGAESNVLTFPILYDNSTSQNPIVGASLDDYAIENGETLMLRYVCYTPGQETTDELDIRVYSSSGGTETDYYTAEFEDIANNTTFTLPISLYPELGTGYIELTSGAATFTLTFTVTEVQTDYDITPVASGLVYSYRPTGYTNNSAGRDTYIYNLTDAVGHAREITTKMNGFNWVTDGYLDGKSLTIAGAARMSIHLPILTTSFQNDANETVVLDAATGATVTTSGRTVEFEFELDNVTNHNSVVFSCLDSNGVGFVITPQVCYLLADGQAPVLDSTGFIENEESIPCAYIKDEKHIRVTFVIQRKRWTEDNRFTSYANIFINGEYANSYLYSEDAIYNGTATITIGSDDCVTKLYDVRMYNRDLSDSEVLRNHMNSAIDIRERISQNEYNDVLNSDGAVDYVKARLKYPCLLFIGRLSNFKADKSMVGVVLTKPDGLGSYSTEFSMLDQDQANKFVSSIKVQGTSSQRFMRKNFKVYLVRNKQDGTGTEKVKYVLKGYDDSDPPQPLSIGESTLCYKADYMSTDHANTFNANIADTLFNDRPAGSLVQNTIYGFRCLLFNMAQADYVAGTAFEDYPEGTIAFAGDGCLNNDKGNTKTFGLETAGDSGADTLQQKWEFKDNSNPLCTFTTDRLMQKVYNEDNVTYKRQARNGLESCYPDEGDLDEASIEPDYSHIQALFTWVYQWANFWDASTTSGTGGTYNGTSYNTERDLKKARFKREFTWHFNMEHALVYYIFIEWVALCDNRAKNLFLSCKNVRSESLVFTDNSISSIWDCVNMETGAVDATKIDWANSTFGVWYTDLYDLDSCFGAENSGYIRIPYYADWNYKLGRTNTYQFNGHDSRLWCMFEEAFADEIKARAQLITRSNTGSGTLNYAVLKQVHITDNAELVCPAIVNDDMEYKYEDAWTMGYYDYSVDPENPTWTQTSAYKYLQRGSRTEQKESFIYRRSMMLYSKYQCDQFLNDQLAFRCGSAVAQADTTIVLSAIQAMWLGVSYGDSGSAVMSAKKAAGETASLVAPNGLGRSDNVHIHGASNLTSVSSLAAFHPYEIGLTNAGKLKTLLIGSDASGYSNGDLSSLDTSACALLDTLNVQGCTGFTDTPINLSANTLIREVYAGGSTVPYFTFANGGILETLELGTPKRIILLNQPYLDDFSYDSLSELVMLRVENTPNVGVLDILSARLSNLRLGIRLIGIDESMSGPDYSLFKALTSAAAQGKRLDANGNLDNDPNAWPVITGQVSVDAIGARTLTLMNTYYPNLVITAAQTITQYTVTFLNADGSPILDTNGNAYIQYVDSGDAAHDPIQSGEVPTPTKASDPHYSYAFDDWDNLPQAVISNVTVTATYTSTVRTYTVTWYDGVGSGNGTQLEQQTGVSYGSCVQPLDNHPTYTALEGNNVFYVFNGWDASTGFITGDTVVKATWIVGTLPDPNSNVGLEDMTMAQIAAIAKNNAAASYWAPKDHFDVVLGRDFHFNNIEDLTLVSTPTYFDGTSTPVIFNGENDRSLIQLFNGTIDSFTIAIDFEFTSDAGALLACFDDNGNQGFQLRRSGNYVNLLWGDVNINVGYQYQRGIMTIRYNKGTAAQVLYIGYDGNTSANIYPINANSLATNCVEAARARATATSTTAPLTLGGIGIMNGTDITSLRATGWIHWCKIWYGDLGTYDAKAIANFPHIPMRFNYDPIQYRNGLDVTSVVAAGFIAENPLPLLGAMNNSGTNVGGWQDSMRRQWMNGQLYDAFPIALQSIIKEARVRSSAGNKSTQIQSTMDKVYLAAMAEAFAGQTDTTYLDEMDDLRHTIPWFVANSAAGLTANNVRVRFPGFILPDDVNIVVDSADPTLYAGTYSVISEKTVWINTSNSNIGFIYVSADYLAKHKHACGRLISSSDNVAAQGADSAGNTGGKWIRAQYWWLRSPYLGNPNYFYNVTGNGSYSNNGANYTCGLVCGFSI